VNILNIDEVTKNAREMLESRLAGISSKIEKERYFGLING